MEKNKRNLGANTIQKEKSMKQTDPIWKKEAMHIWMILRGMQEAIIIQNLRGMSTGGTAGMSGAAMVCCLSVLETGKNIWTEKSSADHERRFL